MRSIDVDELLHCDCKGSFSECDTCHNSELCSLINDAPTVEAIPKAEYEARLKADMVVMLTELKKEMKKEIWKTSHLHYDELENAEHWNNGINSCVDIIQQKINALKENENG